jgi:hypothetical protein
LSWDKSFAKVEKTRKTVRNRGWYPLNYCLLDHPGLVPLPTTTNPDVVPDRISDVDGCIDVENPPDAVNNNQQEPDDGKLMVCIDGSSSSFLQSLLDDQAKSVGRKQKFEEKQRVKEDNENRVNALTQASSTTSGQLAIRNCWVLDENLFE